MGRKSLYSEGLASGRYVRLPIPIDQKVAEMAKEEERELGAVLRRLVRAGLAAEGRSISPAPAREERPVKKRAAA